MGMLQFVTLLRQNGEECRSKKLNPRNRATIYSRSPHLSHLLTNHCMAYLFLKQNSAKYQNTMHLTTYPPQETMMADNVLQQKFQKQKNSTWQGNLKLF